MLNEQIRLALNKIGESEVRLRQVRQEAEELRYFEEGGMVL